ncbi:EAL domain-containing protein [Rhodanobacter sp. DHB23]|uniref:EAL domain-containing protein n=1 Tax=Rhodanobacter sp. DHB23 TaxID=2775923 RepID=UPI00178231ED|nr:EAL domain-containing protein [Rhodanobacter sp. DHB23]MBD8873640.1 EAL domain-containing protein [Rhodanobacter sp. DHB23]
MAGPGDITPGAVHDAILRKELFLEYQPTIALQEGGRCVGCEALVRWRRGAHVVHPMDFVPVIEETPVSGLLTYWVIDTVARELGDWLRGHPDVHVGINVPPEILGRGGLEYAVRKANFADVCKQIILEITERGFPDRLGLEELRGLIREHRLVAMDDVNLDESNFIVLSRQPVPIIKLDRELVEELTGSDGRKLGQISAFTRFQGHYVVAEGVETREQERLLRDAGVQFAQGWLYSKSLSAGDFRAFYASR